MSSLFALSLPILITALLGSSALAGWLIELEKKQKLCVELALKLPVEIRPCLQELLDLNPLARDLRKRKRLALADLAAATISQNPVAIARATTRLEATIRAQNRLDIRQQILLVKVANKNSAWRAQVSSKGGLSVERSTGAAVDPDLPGDLAPVYRLRNNFESEQSAWISWRDRAAHGQCAATLSTELKPKLLAFQGG